MSPSSHPPSTRTFSPMMERYTWWRTRLGESSTWPNAKKALVLHKDSSAGMIYIYIYAYQNTLHICICIYIYYAYTHTNTFDIPQASQTFHPQSHRQPGPSPWAVTEATSNADPSDAFGAPERHRFTAAGRVGGCHLKKNIWVCHRKITRFNR